MVKANKGKKAKADAVYTKKSNAAAKTNPFAAVTKPNPFAKSKNETAITAAVATKKINPFEVHVNREKFKILGRTCKHDKGLPGVSRAKAMKRRTETLGQEYRQKNKSNKFQDRRIGKHLRGDEITEEVMNARFMAEKLSQMKQSKAERFNLNDDEVLTHRGQTLAEIEQFRDERSDGEDGDEEDDLNAEFTEAAHFGGDGEATKDRKTAIDEMIVEHKRRKIEIAKEKDHVHDLTEKLDSSYKDLVRLMGKMSKTEKGAKAPPDEYDTLMREMIFEPRGVVADKLLPDEEVARREKQRLEQLEKDRKRRMLADGDTEEDKPAQANHRSADDLDDGYFAFEQEAKPQVLTYNKDGKLSSTSGLEKAGSDGEEAAESDGTEDDDESEQGESDSDEEEDDGSSDDEDDPDNLSDLKSSDDEAEPAEKEAVQTIKETKEKSATKKTPSKKSSENTEDDDLPFTLEFPASFEEFHELLDNRLPQKQAIIVDRLIKLNHPKLEGVKRDNVVQLFTFLLEHINELFSDATQENITEQFRTLAQLNPHLFDLMHLNAERMSSELLDQIKAKYADYRKNPKNFPPLETIVLLKLVAGLCSASDFRHPIVTPCYIFIHHVLSKARVRNRQDIATGLFLVTIALEYGQLSKRFLPAALNFLRGIIFLSVPKSSVEVLRIVPPFESEGIFSRLLTLPESSSMTELQTAEPLLSEDLVMTTLTPAFKVRALNTTLQLIQDAIAIFGENAASNYLAEPFLDVIDRLPLDVYPAYVRTNCEATVVALRAVAAKHLTKLVPPEKKPKALRLLEPRFETVYDDKRRPKVSQAKEEKLKLLHKVKRETKGAIREIRKDTEFVQKIRIQQQIQSDRERKEKVKRIYAEAAVQQGELNELDRARKKKKY